MKADRMVIAGIFVVLLAIALSTIERHTRNALAECQRVAEHSEISPRAILDLERSTNERLGAIEESLRDDAP